jgi:hypothetical protein
MAEVCDPLLETGVMFLGGSTRPTTVDKSGAEAGQVLCGTNRNNHGLRLVVSQAQQRGGVGPITGSFVILEPGDNKHTEALEGLLHRPTNAEEVLAAIRQHHAGCVNIVNANILIREPERTAAGPDTCHNGTPARGSR